MPGEEAGGCGPPVVQVREGDAPSWAAVVGMETGKSGREVGETASRAKAARRKLDFWLVQLGGPLRHFLKLEKWRKTGLSFLETPAGHP